MYTSGTVLPQPARTAGPILAGLKLRLGLPGASPPAAPGPRGIFQSAPIGAHRGCDIAHQCYCFAIASALPPRPPLSPYPSHVPISPPVATPPGNPVGAPTLGGSSGNHACAYRLARHMCTSDTDLLQPARTADPILAGLRLKLGLPGAPPTAAPNPKGI